MHFSYAEAFGKSSANGYERLLLDAMLGDGTLFAHRDGVEATWALMTPILDAWKAKPPEGFPELRRGQRGRSAPMSCWPATGEVAHQVSARIATTIRELRDLWLVP